MSAPISFTLRRLLALVASVALAGSAVLWLAPGASAKTSRGAGTSGASSTSTVSRSAKPLTPAGPTKAKAVVKAGTKTVSRSAKTARSVKPAKSVTSRTIASSSRSAKANSITPQDDPGTLEPPTNVHATAGNASATVTFTDPNDDLAWGPAYLVMPDPGVDFTVCFASPCVVTGLTNGMMYTFTVQVELDPIAPFMPPISDFSEPSNSVTLQAVAPGAPTGVSATAGSTSASVSFTAPTDDGGASIEHYTVTSSPGGKTATCTVSPCTVTGLTNGTSYTFTVTATNSVGTSVASSASSPVIPHPSVPGAPTGVSAAPGDQSATVSFTAPTDNGGAAITGYTATSNPGGLTGTCAVSPCTVHGLTNGTAYTFTVTATNSEGTSAASTASAAVTPASVPGVPTSVSAETTPEPGQALVSFQAPADDGGSSIISYTVTASPGGVTATCPAGSGGCVVNGLTGGMAYTFTVHATNTTGNSAESEPSDPVLVFSAPAAPSAVSASATATAITVRFATPDDHGSPIDGYEYSLDGGDTWMLLTTSGSGATVTGDITGRQPGTAYSVEVRADNEAGPGGASAPLAVYTLPAALSAPTLRAGISSVTVSWSPSTATHVTGYSVYANPGSATCTTHSISATSCVIGAISGIEYTYTVVVNTPAGDSAASAASAAVSADSPTVPSSAPTSAPTTLTTTKGTLTTVTPGETITLVGTGYLPDSSITLLIYSSPTVLGTTVANAEGDFSKTVTLPSSLAAGAHNIVASGVSADGLARYIRMSVTAAASTTAVKTTGNSTGGSSLASTGTPVLQFALGGIECVVIGGAMLAFSRRRRQRV